MEEMTKQDYITVLDDINICLANQFNIDYKNLYMHLREKNKIDYLKEKPKISDKELINSGWLEKPNTNLKLFNFCDTMAKTHYIYQNFLNI